MHECQNDGLRREVGRRRELTEGRETIWLGLASFVPSGRSLGEHKFHADTDILGRAFRLDGVAISHELIKGRANISISFIVSICRQVLER